MEHLNLFPLFLSLKVAGIATAIGITIGLPLAYYLSRSSNIFADLIDTLLTLPVVLPPTVLGYYLLVLLGRNSPFGNFLEEKFNILIVFTPIGAIIAASIVSIPFFIKSARAAFSEVDIDLVNAAKLLGRTNMNIFFSVFIPLGWRGLCSGLILTFARALGDFGTTLMVSGNIPNKTTTMPIAIYDALQVGNIHLTNTLVFIMTLVAVIILFILNRIEKHVKEGRRCLK